MVQPRQSWDLTLAFGSTTLNLMLARDADKNPMLSVDTAPTLTDSINTQEEVSYAATPPRQGRTQPLVSVRQGAGKRDWKPAQESYAFGESVETEDGVVRPGPQLTQTTLNGGTVLDGAIADHTLHNDGKVYIAAGRRVYYWDHPNTRWQITAANPSAAATITAIISFSNKLYVFHGATANAEYSSDNGATWTAVPGFTDTSDSKATYATIREQRSSRPRLLVTVDPDLVFEAEDPTSVTSWDTGSRVGGDHAAVVNARVGQAATTLDGFTSVTTAPDGTILFGKKMGWRTMDAFGNVDTAFPAIWPSSGQGKANFYKPVVGPRRNLYTIFQDYDILEYDNSSFRSGLGPAFLGQGVTEMEKALTALTGDGQKRLFVALAGTEGYVMKGLYVDGEFVWHGAYAKVGVAITYMWMAIDPQDNLLYLWMAPTLTPFRPYRALIPRENIDTDTNARFVSSANIRYGYWDNGFAHDTKVALQAMPVTRNLISGTRSLELQYRADDASSFTSIGTFTNGPEPSNNVNTYFPAGTTGKKIELKAIITNSAATGQAIIDRIVARFLTRHLRTNIITATVLAKKGQLTRTGGRSEVSGKGLLEALDDALKSTTPPLLTADDGRVWTVDILSHKEIALKNGDMAFQITMIEIPTVQSIAGSTGGLAHTHKLYSFTGNGVATTVTLTNTPIGPVLVQKNDTYMIEGATEDFTIAGAVITFATAPASGADIRVHSQE